MSIFTIVTPGLSIRTYVIIDEKTKNAAVIDPTRNVEPILNYLESQQAKLLFILETHVHADFVSGVKELKSRLGDQAIIGCSILGGRQWLPDYAEKEIANGDEINLGSIFLRAFQTPGHTPEHLMYILYTNDEPQAAFTGDFLLCGTVGRPDLIPSIKKEILLKELFNSINTVLSQFPDNLPIYPAHGAGSLCGKGIVAENTTLGNEREKNPALKEKEFNKWSKDLLEKMPKAPPYFSTMKMINLSGAQLLKDLQKPEKINENDLANLNTENHFFLDVRNQEEFAKSHFKGSINIPFGQFFSRWIGEFIPYNKPIIIISETDDQAFQSIDALHLIGLDENEAYFIFNDRISSDSLNAFPILDGCDLLPLINKIDIIDVRTDAEWNGGHIPSAKHIEVNTFQDNLSSIPKDKEVAFVCGSSYRASIAASMAQKAGILKVLNLRGGMQAWNKANLPIQKP